MSPSLVTVNPMDDLNQLKQWARDYNLKPDDPLWGAYQAGLTAAKSAEAAAKALADIHAAIAAIPIAAERAPKIQQELVALRKQVESLDRKSEKLTREFGSQAQLLLGRAEREQRERIYAIGKEFRNSLDRPPRSYLFWVVALVVVSLGFGGWFQNEVLILHHRIAPAPIAVRPSGQPDCVKTQDGQTVCLLTRSK